MALTQSARLPGPSWDEEVVPALRKRLENESRTLARRISAISMSSIVDDNPLAAFTSNSAADAAPLSGLQQNNYSSVVNGAGAIDTSGASHRGRPGYQSDQQTDQHSASVAGTSTPGASTSTPFQPPNGIRKAPATTSFHRSRTYSQPYSAPKMNGGVRQPRRNNTTNLLDHNDLGSRSPRLVDAKPTRIPKASRGPTGNTTNASSPTMPFLNGAASGVSHSTTPTPNQTPNPNSGYVPDIKAYHFPSSHSAQGIHQHTMARIINEPAPFNTSSSSIYNIHEEISTDELGFRAPRDSIDSLEETPFEHWYRGEVSRNGGVGELRVGRRQEMLDIANYGHEMHNKRRLLASQQAALRALEDQRGSIRTRAGSIAGFARLRRGMRERGSLYLEDDIVLDFNERVLDEDPLTDLDGEEGSDIASISTRGQQDRRPYRYSNHDTDYMPGVGDISISAAATSGYSDTSPPSPQSPPSPHEIEALKTPTQQLSTPTKPLAKAIDTITTPTQPPPAPASVPTGPPASAPSPAQPPPAPAPPPTPRSKSRQGSSSSRIPTFERRSSESRTSAHSQHSSNTTKVGDQHVIDLTSSPTPSPSPPLPSNTSRVSPIGRVGPAPSTPKPAIKRGASPGPHNTPVTAAKKPRTPGATTPGKPKPKPKPAIKKFVKEEDNRRSVAHYPTPGDDADMSNAIPVWTQPKGDGNWDDVVLPVVARKKGLDNFYEKANGSPLPKKSEALIAPAPGTFGYDGTKRRKDPYDEDDIEMDEFGKPKPASNSTPDVLEEVDPNKLLGLETEEQKIEYSVAHDNIRVPVKPPPSPAPFSHYAPTTTNHLSYPINDSRNEEQLAVEQDEKGAGCCKCVVM